MKYYLILLVVLAGIWLWRTNRKADPKFSRKNASKPPEPQAMVRCALCSTHLPLVDVVQGKKGVYCCAEHRQRAES
jgi:uncharacterized protein